MFFSPHMQMKVYYHNKVKGKINAKQCISIHRNMQESKIFFAAEDCQNICLTVLVNLRTSCRQGKAKVLKQLVKYTLNL